jgi:hypothetical protein
LLASLKALTKRAGCGMWSFLNPKIWPPFSSREKSASAFFGMGEYSKYRYQLPSTWLQSSDFSNPTMSKSPDFDPIRIHNK